MDTIQIYISFGVLLLLILVLARMVFVSWLRKRRSLRKMKVGKRVESRAKRIISNAGFKKIRYQENFFYSLKVDGEEVKICVIPDYIAEKNGERCVIEVKWGISAPLISNVATRRQLLEYSHAIEHCRIFLLDMHKKTLKEVAF